MDEDNGAGEVRETNRARRPDTARRLVLAVLTAVLAFAGLGAWAIASPVGAAPDDDYHLASIWCSLGERQGICEAGESEQRRTVSERVAHSADCFKHDPEQSAQCPLDDERMVTTKRGNFAGSYPPLFYATMGTLAGTDVALSTVLMRVLNAAVFVGAVTAVLALLRPGQRGPVVWGGVVTLVPLGMFIIPSVNPSTWAILAGLLVWVSTYGYFTAETRPRRISLGVIAVVLGVMGAGARGDSAVYVAFAALVAMILAFRKDREWLMRAILPLALIVIGAIFFLAAGQATDAASGGVTRAASGAAGGATGAQADASPAGLGLLLSNFTDLPYLWTGGTGTWGLGWYDTPVLRSVWVVMIGAIFALVFWGLRTMDRRKGIVLILALAALIAIPLYVLYGKGVPVGEWVQPRYLLPLFIIFVSVALLGFSRDDLGLTRLQSAFVFAAVAVSNALALRNNMRRYITGIDEGGFNLNANIEWWWNIPVSPMIVWFGGSAAFALALVGLWLWLYPRDARVGESPRDELAAEPTAVERAR